MSSETIAQRPISPLLTPPAARHNLLGITAATFGATPGMFAGLLHVTPRAVDPAAGNSRDRAHSLVLDDGT